jgi:hypothetical protein
VCRDITAQPGSYVIKLKPTNSNIDLYLLNTGGPKIAESINPGTAQELINWSTNVATPISVCAYGYEAGTFTLDVTVTTY